MYGKWFGFEKEEVFEEGLASYESGDFELASEAFEACRRDDPSDPRYQSLLDQCEDQMVLSSQEFQAYSDDSEKVSRSPLFQVPDFALLANDALRTVQRLACTRIEFHPVSLFHH